MRSIVSGYVVVVLATVSLSTATAIDVPIPARVSVIRTAKLAKMVSKAPAPYPLPAPGSPEDPTAVGAELRVFDRHPYGGGDVSFTLGASGWTGLGNPPGSKGYRYKGKRDSADPDPRGTCRVVVLKDQVIKAVCKGPAVSLDTPFVAIEEVVLGLPAGAPATLRYCAALGGDERKNDATLLMRTKAPAPSACGAEQLAKCGQPAFGVCPAPFFCGQLPTGEWSCVPEFCGTFPACNSPCGISGWECKPVRSGSTSDHFCLCSPPPSLPAPGLDCGWQCNGFSCPPGMVCTLGAGSCGCEPS